VTTLILNEEHLEQVLGVALERVRHRLFIATADVKDVHVPMRLLGRSTVDRRRGMSLIEFLKELAVSGVDVRLLHSGIPSGPAFQRIRVGLPESFVMRRCVRVHTKAVIVDGQWAYVGSANFTGAGIGAKGARRRNFEAGICTEDLRVIDSLADMLDAIWNGEHCELCGRRNVCPEPLEEPG